MSGTLVNFVVNHLEKKARDAIRTDALDSWTCAYTISGRFQLSSPVVEVQEHFSQIL